MNKSTFSKMQLQFFVHFSFVLFGIFACWTDKVALKSIPFSVCLFRKSFRLSLEEHGQLSWQQLLVSTHQSRSFKAAAHWWTQLFFWRSLFFVGRKSWISEQEGLFKAGSCCTTQQLHCIVRLSAAPWEIVHEGYPTQDA